MDRVITDRIEPLSGQWEHLCIPHYSIDLNVAFTLLTNDPTLEWNLFSEDDGRITCDLGHWSDDWLDDKLEQATEKTAALAIAKAWLKWMERTDHA